MCLYKILIPFLCKNAVSSRYLYQTIHCIFFIIFFSYSAGSLTRWSNSIAPHNAITRVQTKRHTETYFSNKRSFFPRSVNRLRRYSLFDPVISLLGTNSPFSVFGQNHKKRRLETIQDNKATTRCPTAAATTPSAAEALEAPSCPPAAREAGAPGRTCPCLCRHQTPLLGSRLLGVAGLVVTSLGRVGGRNEVNF